MDANNTAIDYEILNLMRFYQVDTEHQLIKAQAAHIEKLQARVAKTEIMHTPFGVRVPRIGYTNNCDRYKALWDEESTERNANKGRAAISCAEVIRALKVNK